MRYCPPNPQFGCAPADEAPFLGGLGGLGGARQHPWGCGEHLAAAVSSLFLLLGEEWFHISSLMDAVKLQPRPVLNQPQMGHLLLPGDGKSAAGPTELGGAG